MAVWGQHRTIVCLLVVVMLGQWSFLLHGTVFLQFGLVALLHNLTGVLLKAEWMDGACVITSTDNKILAISFLYTMAFDFLVLCLAGWKLAAGERSKLIKLIFGDGLIYFVIAYVCQYGPTNLRNLTFHFVDSWRIC